MPYIKQSVREKIDYGENIATYPGELNYLITTLCLRYMKNLSPSTSYNLYNEVIGVLECVKLEMYRRAVAPYEDEKIKENGDVY